MSIRDLISPWARRHPEGMEVAPLGSFRRELDRLFEDFFPARWEGDGSFVPTLDVSETETDVKVEVEVPGMDGKDVEILLDRDVLTIRGEKKTEEEKKEKGQIVRERRYGKFERRITLPAEVQSDKTKAEYKKGTLTITLPKSEAAKAKTKKIEVSSA